MDKIFKIGLLVMGFGYLAYLYCPITDQAGRYQYYTDSDSMSIYNSKEATVFDTSTGMIYSFNMGKGGTTFDMIKEGIKGDKDSLILFQMKIDEMKAKREAEKTK
jgi:hypothetical protein